MTMSEFSVHFRKSPHVHTNTIHASNPTILPHCLAGNLRVQDGQAVID